LVFFEHHKNSWLLDYGAYDDDDAIINIKPFDFRDRNNESPGDLASLGQNLNTHSNEVKAALLGSSCGLVSFIVDNGDSVFLCNPVLNLCRKISTPRPFRKWEVILHGFGYVSSIDDFKLVLGLRGRSKDLDPMMYVFSLRDNDWKMIQGGDQFQVISKCNVDRGGILVSECLHWWTTPVQHNDDDGRIFAFDLLHEVFEEVIPIPEKVGSMVRSLFCLRGSSGLCTLGGCLCFSFFRTYDNMEVWMLKQYGKTNSWLRVYNICIPSSHPFNFSKCFGLTKTGKFLIWCCDGAFDYYIFLADPKQSHPNVTLIGDFGSSDARIIDYIQSLVSPMSFENRTSQERRGTGNM